MSAANAIAEARAAGVDLSVDGDELVLKAASPPSVHVLSLLTRHKPGILSLLRPASDSWSADEWQAFFDERAGIAAYDVGLPRPEAETNALDCCIAEWLNRNPVCSLPGSCISCGTGESADRPLLPFGTTETGYAWLHEKCWSDWFERRRETAAKALARMGIKFAVRPNGKTD